MTRVNLDRWRQHLETARTQGMPLSHYARANGLSRDALYAANKAVRKPDQARRQAVKELNEPCSPLVAVQIAAPSLRCA
jgi:hypothetical protein